MRSANRTRFLVRGFSLGVASSAERGRDGFVWACMIGVKRVALLNVLFIGIDISCEVA